MKWRVRYMARGMEPPHPCGKCEDFIEAPSRQAAIEKARATRPVSLYYKITASPVKEPPGEQA